MKLDAIAVTVLTASVSVDAFYQGSTQQPFISQKSLDGFNILKYLGGYGPYVDRESLGISRDPPQGCEIDQVVMAHRHGARFPDSSSGEDFENTIQKLEKADIPQNHGSLSFFKDWDYFVEDRGFYGLETFTGPYAGLLDAYQRGTEYRERYGHLWDKQSKVAMFSSGTERIVQTARKFGEGFFGFNYTDVVEMNVILETEEMGANSLTPHCGVPDNAANNATKKDFGKINPHFYVAAERLNNEYTGLNLTDADIYNLQQIASYEMNVRPWSPWLNVFTKEEWIGYQYLRDCHFYYYSGPGSYTSKPKGSVFTNSTLQLLKSGPCEGSKSMYWTFMHDVNIVPILAALGLTIPVDADLPLNGTIPFYNQYKSSEIVPMGAHLVLERMQCDKTAISDEGLYVRAVLNEAVVPFPNCHDGPGYSCSLENYEHKVVMENYRPYTEVCEVSKEWPQYVDFFWNYNSTNKLDHEEGDIPYQYHYWVSGDLDS